MNEVNLNIVKLIIWDLDDTFWDGTISEGEVNVPNQNVDLIKTLSGKGIINSICSKNDYGIVELKLKEIGLYEYFVFMSINWESKGQRVKSIIEKMNLRPENVLFIDDNISNLKEVEHYNDNIMISLPNIIDDIALNVKHLGKNDYNMSRLNQYKILEQKVKSKEVVNDNYQFLVESQIVVKICEYDEKYFERLLDLANRSNQLNFTKNRYTQDSFANMISSSDAVYYVTSKDIYGDYGIIGFISILSSQITDFVFSCRIMGMGVEQFVYDKLGYPSIVIKGPVSSNILDFVVPDYINSTGDSNEKEIGHLSNHILLKGPCDLQVLASFIKNNDFVDIEFNFIDEFGSQVDYFNHSANIRSFADISDEEKKRLSDKYNFVSEQGFETKLFDEKYGFICYSLMMDSTLNVYKSRETNTILAYGLYNLDITDSSNFNSYVNKEVMTARSNFSYTELEMFSQEFEKIEYSKIDIVENIKFILNKISNNCKVIIMLLPELEYGTKTNIFSNKHLIHIDINESIKREFSKNQRVILLDVNKYIKKQSDYFDSINHYSKKVYYHLAEELILICKNDNANLQIENKFKMFKQHVKRNLYKLFKRF